MKIIRKNNAILAIVIVLMLSVFVSPEPANAITPICEIRDWTGEGGIGCSDAKQECVGLVCGDNEWKIDIPEGVISAVYKKVINGYYIKATLTQPTLKWESNFDICFVILKAGTGANVYSGGLSGEGLIAPDSKDISHFTFCYSDPECPPPECIITALDVCENSTGNTASVPDAGSGATYDWKITGGTITSDKPYKNSITWNAGAAGTATLTLTVTDSKGCTTTCFVNVTVDPCEEPKYPICIIAGVEPICAGESVQLYAAVNGGTPGYTYSWDDGGIGGTFNNSSIEDPIWNSPSGFTGIATLTLTVMDSNEYTTTCSVNVTVNPCEECECSLVVLKRDEAGHPIDGAVFEVDGIQKTITGGEARWDNLECNTTYEVKEISPEKITRRITLGDCGERSTMRVVNKGEEGELEVLGIMEVLPFTGPAIPYSPFIGISTVLAGAVLYILSKPKKKR